jgi:hypothetical protein
MAIYSELGMISTSPLAANPRWSAPAPIVELRAGTPSLRGVPTTSGRTLSFGLNCVGEFVEACRGTATITTTERIAANGHTIVAVAKRRRERTVVIGRITFTTGFAGNGGTHTFRVALNKTGRHLLARFKRLPATLTVRAAARELRVPPKVVTVKAIKVTFKARNTPRRTR